MRHLVSRSAGAMLAAAIMASPAAAIDLPFGFGQRGADRAAAAEPPVLLAQAGDPTFRISQLEEEIRRLTGRVEEMSFLVLQLQEQLRNAQADNDLRFQDLEGGSGGGGAPEQRGDAAPAGVSNSGDQEFALGLPAQTPGSVDPEAQHDADEVGVLLDTTSLGTIGSSTAPQTSAPATSGTVAAIEPRGEGEMYSLAYNYLLAGDYQLAETTFRQYADTYPNSADAPDARYWLGESLFAQRRFRDAAEVFLNAQKAHPESGKAPEMMLKLGMSLARLDNADTACVTYAEVGRRYPGMSDNVKRKLSEEESAANCG